MGSEECAFVPSYVYDSGKNYCHKRSSTIDIIILMFYRRNSDITLRELKRQAKAHPGDEGAQKRFQAALARVEGHNPCCAYIKYYLSDEKIMQDYAAEIEKYTSEWPDYCVACGGWGGHYSSYDPSPAGVSLSPGYMIEYDPCRVCVEQLICPRCGKETINLVESRGGDTYLCAGCGWKESTTAGLPQDPPHYTECTCWEMGLYG